MSDAANNNNNNNDGWRSSVLQSYRNAEVREIAKVLAALEGSVSANTKLVLAMKFEDQIFRSVGSLADYKKKITKRLKKLQKNYVRPTAATPNGAGGGGRSNGSAAGSAATKEELETKLRRDYGEELRYIVKNASAAVADLKQKGEPEKARQLQQHTDSCRIWARDLGAMTEKELEAVPVSDDDGINEQQLQNNDDAKKENKLTPSTTKNETMISNKAVPLSLSQLQRIEEHLRKRISNIRSYVVRHADPDQYIFEMLKNKDENVEAEAGNLFSKSLAGRISTQQNELQKNEQQQKKMGTLSSSDGTDVTSSNEPILVLQQALEKAQAGVPPPTKNKSNQIEATLRHLDKMRAASTAMMTYWTLKGDERLTTAPRDTLKKIHDVVQDGADSVLAAVKEREKQQRQQRHGGRDDGDTNSGSSSSNSSISIQDAWSKTIELPSSAPEVVVGDDSDSKSDNKRLRTSTYRPYYKVRILFHPERKTPDALLSAIRRKGARLIAHNNGDTNSIHLILDFDEAFTMTIYLSPLTVTLRAWVPKACNGSGISSDATATTITWRPLSYGLTPFMTMDGGCYDNTQQQQQQQQQRQLSVWGVTSTYNSIGRVVEERLRDASTHATFVLRRCFQNHVKDKTADFEVELLEGSALLEFLQMARATYMPHWVDTDT